MHSNETQSENNNQSMNGEGWIAGHRAGDADRLVRCAQHRPFQWFEVVVPAEVVRALTWNAVQLGNNADAELLSEPVVQLGYTVCDLKGR